MRNCSLLRLTEQRSAVADPGHAGRRRGAGRWWLFLAFEELDLAEPLLRVGLRFVRAAEVLAGLFGKDLVTAFDLFDHGKTLRRPAAQNNAGRRVGNDTKLGIETL